MKITIIIPAFNEAAYLPSTLGSIQAAVERLRAQAPADIEVIVVDNNSTDETAAVAQGMGALVLHEPVQSIARARNTGARHAAGDVLIFVDADVAIPQTLLSAIHAAMNDSDCIGGGVDVEYQPRRFAVRFYLRAWRIIARLTGMVQGAVQFCRSDAFAEIGGYDESAWIGEDVDFYWSLKRFAKASHRTVRLIRSPRVQPSSRRFDKWPIWRILIWTNPLFIMLFRRWKRPWSGWYSKVVR
ncbi:MAG: glycosyltransferase [Chloroflexota bacterium]|nr:glycosyltransferase [Chloroflexota bacterium]